MLNPSIDSSPSVVSVHGTALEQSLQTAQEGAARWRKRVLGSVGTHDPEQRWLAAVPDVGPTCEVLLADSLFHDLSPDERDELLAWVRGCQDESGAWLAADGDPDLSLTVLGWWARRCGGDDPLEDSMVRAERVVHAMGGAQRSNFGVRLWLALAGAVPWDYLPALPGELFLLPRSTWLSPSRCAPWARGVLTPYYVIARGKGKVQLPDPEPLLLRRDFDNKTPVPPRLTRPGLAGDLLQAFDRGVKVSRKLPRGPLPRWALERACTELDQTRQRHGGWFSTRPTIVSLVALRVRGAASDDPRILGGLAQLRASRGWATIRHGRDRGKRGLAQGLGGTRLSTAARLVQADPNDADLTTLLRMELSSPGPWQDRANALAGGWSHDPGAEQHLDLDATCSMLSLLSSVSEQSPLRSPAWAARRRAVEIVLAMQEHEGGFARFERGESNVFMRRLPWSDADLLAMGQADDHEHLRLCGRALAMLGRTGFRLDDDRFARGASWLDRAAAEAFDARSIDTLAALAEAAVTFPPGHDLRSRIEHRLRNQQREDGSFGDVVQTSRALAALTELSGPCVQTHRAARQLASSIADGDLELPSNTTSSGFGLSHNLHDPSAPAREATLALRTFTDHLRASS